MDVESCSFFPTPHKVTCFIPMLFKMSQSACWHDFTQQVLNDFSENTGPSHKHVFSSKCPTFKSIQPHCALPKQIEKNSLTAFSMPMWQQEKSNPNKTRLGTRLLPSHFCEPCEAKSSKSSSKIPPWDYIRSRFIMITLVFTFLLASWLFGNQVQ